MKERSFDEMIAYFNRRVSEMDIAQDYKMELLGMVTALGFKHEKSAQQWIPCSERLPDTNGDYLVTGRQGAVNKRRFEDGRWYGNWTVTAWRELPEPYKGEQE